MTNSYTIKTNRRFWKLLKRWMKLQRQPSFFFSGIKTKITILLHTVLSWSVKPRPKLTNYSYSNQLRDQKCRNTLPRWFTDANHNKDKTNISLSSHVSLWGLSACLSTASMKGSHLLLFPSELEMKQAFLFAPQNKTLQVTATAQKHLLPVAPTQVSIWASHLAQRIGPNSTVFLCGSVFFFLWVCVFF